MKEILEMKRVHERLSTKRKMEKDKREEIKNKQVQKRITKLQNNGANPFA